MTSTTFTFKNITFVVIVNSTSGVIQYRDNAHLGGPWSDAHNAVVNKTLDAAFRKGLREAIARLQDA